MVELIAELGSNWMGNLHYAKQLIYKCVESGVRTVKFQYWRQEHLYPHDSSKRKFELSLEQVRELKNQCDYLGVELLLSVFEPHHIGPLNDYVQRWKVACSQNENLPLILNMLQTGKEILISTSNLGVVMNHMEELGDTDQIKYLYCVPQYPPDLMDLQLNNITENNFEGYSNHYPSIIPCLVAVSLGAEIIETHVTPSRILNSPDAPFALTFKELEELQGKLTKIEVML